MFGRIFAISLGVRAHFAPGPCVSRGAERRAKKFSAQRASSRVLYELMVIRENPASKPGHRRTETSAHR
jgi:hypothetical protein